MITRLANPADVPGIIDLLTVSFPRHMRSGEHWHWSHSDGRGLAVVVEDEDRIIGHYSFGLYKFRRNGRDCVGGFGRQAAVHPERRDLKTAVEMLKFAEQAASERCDFIFAFPNGNMAPIKERLLGWKKVKTFPWMFLSLDEFAGRVGRNAGTGCSVRRLTSFASLDLSLTPESNLLTPVRDAAWFDWRYMTHPLNHYACFGAFTNGKCEGVMALKAYFGDEERLGHIVELHSMNGRDARPSLLSVASDFFKEMKIDRVAVWNEFKPNQSLYRDLGFEPSSATSTLCAKSLSHEFSNVTDAGWSFDMGVSDVF